MKLFTFANTAWKPMLDRFLGSIKDDYEIQVEIAPFIQSVGVFSPDVWQFRTKMIIGIIKKNMGEKVIVCDNDIQFFKPTKPIIDAAPDVDLLGQYEPDKLNIGFTVIKCNEKTLKFFKEVKTMVMAGHWEESVINEKLNSTLCEITWAKLPEVIWGYTPYQPIPPVGIVSHHATFAYTLKEKLEQMDRIKKLC